MMEEGESKWHNASAYLIFEDLQLEIIQLEEAISDSSKKEDEFLLEAVPNSAGEASRMWREGEVSKRLGRAVFETRKLC